jgi:hypothetical protein
VMRGIELRAGRVRGFRVDERGLHLGPPRRAPPGRRLHLLLSVTPDGAVGIYTAAPGRSYARVGGGPAETGQPPTRVAVTCRGTGAARIASLRVVASREAP